MAQSFSFEQSCVIFTDDISPATNRKMPRLFVQCIDAYRYQREFSVSLRWEPGNSKKLFWEAHTYKHPGQRHIVRLTAPQALKVSGAGMDMGFAVVYSLSIALHGTKDKGADAIEQSAAGRPFKPRRGHFRAGYSLTHRWV